MRKIDWGRLWHNIINVAALTGVVLVLVQLRQNAELLELQVLNQEANNYIDGEMAMVGDDYALTWAKMIEDPQNLTLGELRALDSHLWAHTVVRWRNLYDLYEKGLLEEDAWKRTVGEDLVYELAHPYGRATWEEVRDSNFLPEPLAIFIDERLAKAPSNGVKHLYEQRIRRAREILAANSEAHVR